MLANLFPLCVRYPVPGHAAILRGFEMSSREEGWERPQLLTWQQRFQVERKPLSEPDEMSERHLWESPLRRLRLAQQVWPAEFG
jgi:hypothetical protein